MSSVVAYTILNTTDRHIRTPNTILGYWHFSTVIVIVIMTVMMMRRTRLFLCMTFYVEQSLRSRSTDDEHYNVPDESYNCFFSNSVPGVVVVLLSFKLDFGFIHPYFSVVKRWSFYVSVSLCTTYDVRCTMYDDNDNYYYSCCCCC